MQPAEIVAHDGTGWTFPLLLNGKKGENPNGRILSVTTRQGRLHTHFGVHTHLHAHVLTHARISVGAGPYSLAGMTAGPGGGDKTVYFLRTKEGK